MQGLDQEKSETVHLTIIQRNDDYVALALVLYELHGCQELHKNEEVDMRLLHPGFELLARESRRKSVLDKIHLLTTMMHM